MALFQQPSLTTIWPLSRRNSKDIGVLRQEPAEGEAAAALLFDSERYIYVGAVILGSEAYHDGALVGFVFT